MYWKQFLLGIGAALLAAYVVSASGFGQIPAILAGLATYVVVRAIMTWMIRVKYWYPRNSPSSQTCPSCGQYVYRIGGDWVLTCKECGWKPGWPVIRLLMWSVPVTQLRRTVVDPKLGLGLSSARSGVPSRVRGTVRAVFTRGFLVLSILLVGVGIIGGLYTGVLDDEQVPGIDSEDVFGESFDEHEVEQAIHVQVNEIRSERGLPEVDSNSALDGVARDHSLDMAERDFFAHENPDGMGPTNRVMQSQVTCQTVGENIAQTYWRERVEAEDGMERFTTNEELAEGLVQQWMNSPPHRENLLDRQWTTLGVGIHLTDDGEVLATQKFCR